MSKKAIAMGGSGSGNWGHKGRPGKVGGSAPGGGRKAGDVSAYGNAPAPNPPRDFYLKSFLTGKGDVLVYHVTDLDDAESIAEHGLIPGAHEATGQSWKADHSDYATYFHVHESGAKRNFRDAPDELVVVVGKLPRTREMAGRILPDEDVSTNNNRGMYHLYRKDSIAVIAGLERENISGFIVGPATDPRLVKRLKDQGYDVQVGGW